MAVDQKGLRRYTATVERSLALFDPNSDWADHIAFLSRLLKALESGKPDGVSDVPSKARIALCLSRCLQPTLPSGVHQKALDVYNEIFSIIGISGLARDLTLYLPGLSHTLAFANLATRPLVLDLYEKYVLKVHSTSLRPALKALILSLLPVVEEETSEDFDRCLRTFDLLRLCFSEQRQESYFWQTLFVASVSNPLRRAGILVYLTRYLPKLTPTESSQVSDQVGASLNENPSSFITTPEPGLLVRCFATGLRDEQALIQRGFLDLLVTHLPLNANVLQNPAYWKDLDVLVTAAIMVVLRRDMSLNRRLWVWLTGSDGKASEASVTSPLETTEKQLEIQNELFIRFGLASVVRGVQSMLKEEPTSPGSRTIPFRVGLSLMDRWDIGGVVVRATFAPMMRHLLVYQSSAPTQAAFDEVFRSANVFFDGIESATVFECLSELLHQTEYELISFIVSNFNLEQADRVSVHVTDLGVEIAEMALSEKHPPLTLIVLLRDLMTIVPQAGVSASKPISTESTSLLLRATIRLVCATLEDSDSDVHILNAITCFEIALMLHSSLTPVTESGFLDRLALMTRTTVDGSHRHFIVADACCKVLTTLLVRSAEVEDTIQQQYYSCVPHLVSSLWAFLGTKTPQYHVTVVENIWRLNDLTSEFEIVESTILDLLSSETSTGACKEEGVEQFGTLFHHTKTVKRAFDDTIPQMLCRPSLRILDALYGEDRTEPGAQWLLSLQSIGPLLDIALHPLSEQEESALTLNRVQKIIRIVKLTQSHWRVFSESSNIEDVYRFCLPFISTQDQRQSHLTHDVFMLLRTLYGEQSGNTPPDELITLLVEKLRSSLEDPAHQEQTLDTLLAILSDNSILPSSVVPVLLQGLSSVTADERLDKWVTLLCNFLPNHAALLPSLLKVTAGFCKRIEQAFDDLRLVFDHAKDSTSSKSPERSIANLLSGLEYVLARSHQSISQKPLSNATLTNGTGHEIVSGRSRANDHLTVTLCMQDAVKICARLWSWKSGPRTEVPGEARTNAGDTKSFQYTAMKLRSRSRRVLENLIEAEPQECLEALVGMWVDREQLSVLGLLQTLNGARPRSMMPAVFNAIYSRTNPAALAPGQKSSLSIQLAPKELIWFLNEYTTALEDDMLEEIWPDCSTFLKEVLSNPMPHRQILIQLVQFCGVLSKKMENTNFSEESRMHRELADLCARLFTAIFTIKPAGFDGSASVAMEASKSRRAENDTKPAEDDMLNTLINTLPYLGPALAQHDRLNTVYTGISTNITSPSLHSRTFPNNLTIEHLDLMRQMASSSGISKTWKRDILDSFNHPKFFMNSPHLAAHGWLPLIKQLHKYDKTTITECLNRITPPAAAGIMFGVGATAARNEADRRTQFELRKVTTVILSFDMDGALPYLQLILQKIEDLFTATTESSPSLATRGEIYLLLRALLLKTTHSNLSQFWPLLDAELRELCKDLLAGTQSKYTEFSKMQGAKLLDLLLLMRPDEFQLHEWLFITDTIDAIYPPPDKINDIAPYADEIASVLGANGSMLEPQTSGPRLSRKPWLFGDETRNKEDIEGLLAGFFGQLSIRAFEDLYSLQLLDMEACRQDLIADVFSDTIA